MSIMVRLPSVLKKLAYGEMVPVNGKTVGEALENVVRQFPILKDRLFTLEGKIRPFLLVCLNGEDIRFKEQILTPVADGDEISIIPAISGG